MKLLNDIMNTIYAENVWRIGMNLKKITSFILGVTMITSLCSCSKDPSQSQNSSLGSGEIIETNHDLDSFDLEKYLAPVWSGNVSYAESAFVRQNEQGKVEPIQLLYDIDEIISVRSFDLKTQYIEGVDYRVTNKKLEIIEGGSIPVLEYSKHHIPVYVNDGLKTQIPASDNSGSAYILSETTKTNPGMSAWSIAVTYKHSSKSVVTIPTDNSSTYIDFLLKLKNGENVKAVFYGDSITYGWAVSKTEEVSREPYCPSYPNLVMDYIENKFGVVVERANHSRSGETTNWAKEYVNYMKVVDENPDIVILAFGMNDAGGMDSETFISNIKGIMRNITTKCKEKWDKDVPFVVVGTMLPNDKVGFNPGSCLLNYHNEYAEVLETLTYNKATFAFANVTQVHNQMLTRKVFQDTTSSNSNHPNDYMHRVYAQVVLRTILGNQYN